MNSEENLLLSDDEDLPDLPGSNSSSVTEQKFEIAQHDIVWAEFRKLYWPALVRCVKKKEKKASIWYLDSPRKCFKVKFEKIKSFSDPKMTAIIKSEVEHSPMKAKHKKVWLNAITYIRRKTQGYNDDPASFFDLNKHYLAHKGTPFDEHSSEEIKNSDTTLKIENSDTTLKIDNSDTSLKVENSDLSMKTNNDDPTSSDEESLVSDDEEGNVISKKLSAFTNLDESYENDPEADKIVKCIAAGHVDKHLLQVKSKKVPSQYQELYEDALKTNKQKLLFLTPTDHVKSTKQLKEIVVYLMNYYEKTVEGGKCEMNNYVLYVWVPEAISKAAELISEGSLNLNKAIPESRRKLFPTDKLVYEEFYDPIAAFQKNCVTQVSSQKRGRPKSNKKKLLKKVKIADINVENKLPARSPNKTESKSTVKSPYKKESKSTVKSPNKTESKSTVKSPNKKESKSTVKSLQMPLRSSTRKKAP